MAERAWLGPVLAGAVAFIVGLAVFALPFLTRKREVVASTPASASLFEQAQLPLKPGDELCVAGVPFDDHSQVARFGVFPLKNPGAPLRVRAVGPGYSYVTKAAAPRRDGPVEVQLRPPARAVTGRLCVRNQSDKAVAISATPVGRRFARAQPLMNDFPLEQDVPLTLHERDAASVAERLGSTVGHADVFVPLPAWALWLLLAAVVVVVPAGALWAVAAAGAASLPAPDPRPTAPAVPLAGLAARTRPARDRALARARAVPPAAWLALLALAAFAFLYLWASRVGSFQNDEDQYVYLGRWLTDNLPSGLWNFDLFQRGLQRLEIFVLALGLGTMRPPGAFLFAHAVNAAAFASATVPAWLIVRRMVARPGWALLAAFLVVAVPWTVYATSFLTEPLAYPISLWAVWAVWRGLVDPRPGTELLAVALIGLAALTRSSFVVLAAMLPLAVLIQELRFGSGPRPRALAAALWARHRVVSIAVLAGLAAFLASSAGVLPDWHDLAGGYGTPFSIQWDYAVPKTGLYFSRVVAGVGFVPFAVGLAWLVRELARPREAVTHAYAVTAALAILLIVYSSAVAGTDERYVIYYGPLLVVAAATALGRRDVGPLLVGAAGVLGAVLLWRHGWNPNGGPFGFFVGPAESFYARVFLPRVNALTPSWLSQASAAFGVALVIAAACAYAFSRRPRAAATATAIVIALVCVQLLQAQYSISNFVDQGGERFGPPKQERAWIDRKIYGDSTAAVVALAQANTTAWDPIWREVQFWNTSVNSVFSVQPHAVQIPIGDYVGELVPDEQTGAMVAHSSRLPPYGVIPRGYVDFGIAGTAVAHGTYVPVDLVRFAHPLQVRFHAYGPAGDGTLGPGGEARIRFFSRRLGRGDLCARVPLLAPTGDDGAKPPLRWRLGDERGVVPGGGEGVATTRLRFRGSPHVDVALVLDRKVKLGGSPASGQVGQITVTRCGGG